MKKVYLILMIVGTLFACSKDEPVKSSLASIDDFKIEFKDVDAKEVHMEGLGTENITVSVPFGADLKGKVTVIVSQKATVTPVSGTEVTFVDGVAQDFVVKAEDGTVKIYKVTVNVRGEVGSGTKLKKFKEDGGGVYPVVTYEFTYNEANLVSGYTRTESEEKEYVFKYDAKNQIISKENAADKEVVTYSYNDEGQIASAEEKRDGELITSYMYEYDDKGHLVKLTATKDGNDYIQEFEYKGNNVITHKIGKYQKYEATFDDKNNPFIGIFPSAYGKILAGNYANMSVNQNNIITRTGADEELKYEYNKDNYPVSYSYTIFAGSVSIVVTFEYF